MWAIVGHAAIEAAKTSGMCDMQLWSVIWRYGVCVLCSYGVCVICSYASVCAMQVCAVCDMEACAFEMCGVHV